MSTIEKVVLKDVRLSFPNIFKPNDKPNSRGEVKYKASFLFAPDSDARKVAKAALLKVAAAEYGANWQAIVGAMEPSKKCLRNGDTALDKAGNVRTGYAGQWYVAAGNAMKPKVVGGRKGPDGQFVELDPNDGKPYGGCYVNAIVEITAMKAFGEAPSNIFAKLIAVQFLRDGDAFGAGPTSAEGFDEVEGAPAVAAAGDDLFG